MPQVRLDFNLPPQLVLYVGLLQLVLEQHLHRWRQQRHCVPGRGAASKQPVAGHCWADLVCSARTAATQCCLSRTLSATMYLLCRSRARYTFPNLPRPSGLPMSKSVSCQRRMAAAAPLLLGRSAAGLLPSAASPPSACRGSTATAACGARGGGGAMLPSATVCVLGWALGGRQFGLVGCRALLRTIVAGLPRLLAPPEPTLLTP